MNINELPFDTRDILAGVRPWVETESPSWDGTAVSRVTALAAQELAQSGAEVRTITGARGWGDCVFADFSPEDTRPGILVMGHLDTVHPIGALAGPLAWREDGNKCYGPGLFDMKSGDYMALEAARKVRAAGLGTLPLRFLFTSDEESGSPANRNLIETMARAQKYILVPEGAQPNGNIVSGRFPTRRLILWTRGAPSHALLQKGEGRSALTAMARIILEVEALNNPLYSVTPTIMQGGRAVSTVPLETYAEVICTARSIAALDQAQADIAALVAKTPGCTLDIEVKSNRPHWIPNAADQAMVQLAVGLAKEIGFDTASEEMFGGSDGNMSGALGVPTLDGLGPVGADAHQLTEHILIDSIVPRTRLMAGLMATLA